MRHRPRPILSVPIALLAAAAPAVAGCGASSSHGAGGTVDGKTTGANVAASPNAPETNPAGDIPDNQAYVPYRAPDGFTVNVPEGWSQQTVGGATVFTDKLNAIRVESAPARAPLTLAHVRATVVPRLASTVSGFQPGTVTTVARKAGTAVRITYLDENAPDPVTGKRRRDAVERYIFSHRGRTVTLTLSGPQSADNVDPWRTITDSLRWSA